MSEVVEIRWTRSAGNEPDGTPIVPMERFKTLLNCSFLDASKLSEVLSLEMGYFSKHGESENDTLKGTITHMHYVLTQLLHSIPSQRDWLDPDLEKIAKQLVDNLMADGTLLSEGSNSTLVTQ